MRTGITTMRTRLIMRDAIGWTILLTTLLFLFPPAGLVAGAVVLAVALRRRRHGSTPEARAFRRELAAIDRAFPRGDA